MNPPVYCKALTFKGVMCASDGDAWRKTLVMGKCVAVSFDKSVMTG